jgi:hypothetical protein
LPRPSLARRLHLLRAGVSIAAAGTLLFGGHAGAKPPSKPKPKPTVASTYQPMLATDRRLTYNFKVGEKRRYKLAAFFVGHFPPIALEGNPPANLEADILYVMTVHKIGPKGAEVEFVAETADIYLLEKDPGPDVVVKDDDKIPVPVSLEQIQKALNVTALIQPNGTVATVSGGDNNPIKVDIGFDLRKMFLTILPVVFTDKPHKPGETWSFDDGVLGHKPGATTYTATLEKTVPGKTNALSVTQTGQTVIDNKLDKEGNSTEKAADQVGSLTGKVTSVGRVIFAAAKAPAGSAVQVTESRLNMVALLKRIIPDPAEPGKTSETNIDVKARLVVKPDITARKTAAIDGTSKEKR